MVRYFAFLCVLFSSIAFGQVSGEYRLLPLDVFRDKMMGGWVGQKFAVAWGAPTEAKFLGVLVPEDKVPAWDANGMINNSFGEDDLYVEMTFVKTLEDYGFDVTSRQAGIDFANTQYILWGSNSLGRTNLRKGIAPPDCSHPAFSFWPVNIDYQIEADFSGLIAPGLPQVPVDMGETFGCLVNYGDGKYAGQFIGAMYSAAFFEDDPLKIVEEGLKAIPAECEYARCVRAIIEDYKKHPYNWLSTWEMLYQKFHVGAGYKRNEINYTAMFNGAFVVVGLLYGEGDIEKTAMISMRCGQDSDCNPSSSAGIIGTVLGYSKIPDKFKSNISKTKKYSFTDYTFDGINQASERLARQAVVRAGGKIFKDEQGKEYFAIPVSGVTPSPFDNYRKPGPIAGSKYTEEEMVKITEREPVFGKELGKMEKFEEYMPGWEISGCYDGILTFYESYEEIGLTMMTNPVDLKTDCVLSKTVAIPANKKTVLHLRLYQHFMGDFILQVRVDGKVIFDKLIDRGGGKYKPFETDVDLTRFAGKTVNLELVNKGNNLGYERAYWSVDDIKLISK